MPKSRASIFEQDEDLDLSAFQPKPAVDPIAPSAEEVRAVSEKANFRSREARAQSGAVRAPGELAANPQLRQQRRYRTGRNVQLNIKVTAQTCADFNQITEENGWVGGETLERALAALRRVQGMG